MRATRPGFRARGYTGDWDRLSREFKQRYPFCLGCWSVGLETPTELIDHVRPLTRYREGLLDPANLQPSCRWHHDCIKRAIEVQVALGSLPESALKLDSVFAMRLTRERYLVPIRVDGFREWEWSDLQLRPYPGGWP